VPTKLKGAVDAAGRLTGMGRSVGQGIARPRKDSCFQSTLLQEFSRSSEHNMMAISLPTNDVDHAQVLTYHTERP
jgi:hypothetical protein